MRGGSRILWHLAKVRLRHSGHLGVGSADCNLRLEEDFDDPDASIGVGFDVLDVVDRRRQRARKWPNDAACHLLRRKTRVLPDDADNGDMNFRKNIDGRSYNRQTADQQNGQCEHDERIGLLQRYSDQCGQWCNPVLLVASSSRLTAKWGHADHPAKPRQDKTLARRRDCCNAQTKA